MGDLVRGPGLGGPRVVQTADRSGWWVREGGALWIRPRGGVSWVVAPVPMAVLEGPAPEGRPERTRITAALDLAMMDGPEVDEALGVANALDTTVDAWEAGSEVPTLEEVRRLAFLTGQAPGWFFGLPMVPLKNVFVCRR